MTALRSLLLLSLTTTSCLAYTVPIVEKSVWPAGTSKIMHGTCTFVIGQHQDKGDWTVNMTLSKATQSIQLWIMNVTSQHKRGKWYAMENLYPYGPQTIDMEFQVTFTSKRPPKGTCETNLPEPSTTKAPTTTSTISTSTMATTPQTTDETISSSQPTTSATGQTTSTTHPTTSATEQTTSATAQTTVTTNPTTSTEPATSATQQMTSTTQSTSVTGSSYWSVPMERMPDNWFENGHNFTKMKCNFPLSNTLDTFNIIILLNEPSLGLTIWIGTIISSESTDQMYTLSNNYPVHPPNLYFDFIVEYSSKNYPSGTCNVDMSGQTFSTPLTTKPASTTVPSSSTTSSVPLSSTFSTSTISTTKSSTSQSTTSNPGSSTTPELDTDYDYAKVLEYSILFYEAQRSGKLPANNRIPYRKDSALGDGSDVGLDLTGGWFDAGDMVKFNFPMAASTTVLAWGLSEWRNAYQAAGQLGYMLDSIKWTLDYFLKCWRESSEEYYAQVGNGGLDHGFWGRPEEMTMSRPSYKVTRSKPGSDVAGETAAALAIGSLVFRKEGKTVYADDLLSAAKSLYSFAYTYRGKYSDAIPDAANYYNSFSGFDDELCYSAAMLYKVTGDDTYLQQAEEIFGQSLNKKPWAFSWDDKIAGCHVLLFEATGKSTYGNLVISFLQSYLPGGDVHKTPGGLAWRDQWGALRYSANSAFIALMAAENGIGDVTSYQNYAKSQLHYMFGENEMGRSYVIGFGSNYPKQPHHRSSSCDDLPAVCNWNDYNKPGPNPQILYGALVGGPDKNGQYVDQRNDYVQNEVACDYNAGFQSSVAGLLNLALPNQQK